MFGADVGHLSMLDAGSPGHSSYHDSGRSGGDQLDYLIPKFQQQLPWLHSSSAATHQRSVVGEDFILIAEFSEQEGPRPVIVIPKDGGQQFDQNEFSVKILAVDHQSSIVEGCNVTEDAQVVMSDLDQGAHAFIHHIVLNDIQARGYVRPFCITYVTSDPTKVMRCYEKLSTQLKEVAKLMKFGNRLVFMRDLEKRLEDLDYTKTQLLISQSRSTSATSSQGDSELLQMLNTIRQCMEEVKDIMASLKTQLMDKEIEERFHVYERRLRFRQHTTSESCSSDTSSLKEFSCSSELSTDTDYSGSFTHSPEFSLFIKSKDLKPKLLDVSAIGGKRRFDRSLRGLHELCSWGAKEGLQKLRMVRESLRRDLSSITLEDFDLSILSPDSGVLSFGHSSVGANFLSAVDSSKDQCCLRRIKCSPGSFNHMSSFGSFDSFKSLPSSYQSLLDDDAMYSVNSSVQDTGSAFSGYERQNSEEFGLTFTVEDVIATDTRRDSEFTLRNHSSLSGTLTGEADLLPYGTEANIDDRSSETSEFETICIEKDLKCVARGCSCEDHTEHSNDAHKKTTQDTRVGHAEDSQKKRKYKTDGAKQVKSEIEENDKVMQVEGKVAMKTGLCECSDYDDCEEGMENVSRFKKVGDVQVCIECKRPKVEFFGGIGALNSVNASLDDILDIETLALTDSSSTISEAKTEENNGHNIDGGSGIKQVDNNCIPNIDQTSDQLDEELSDSFDADRETPQPNMINKSSCDKISVIAEESESDSDKPNDTNTESTTYFEHKIKRTDEMTAHRGPEATNKDIRRLSESSVSSYYGSRPDGMDSFPDSTQRHSISGSSSSMLDSTELRLMYGVRDTVSGHLARALDGDSGRFSHDGNVLKQLHLARKRLKWTSHGFSMQADQSTVHCVQKALTSYNNMHHVVYSLLSRKPVIVMATERHEAILKEMVKALSVFTPVTQGGLAINLVCQVKQLKVAEARKFQIRGMIRSDRRTVDFLVPSSVRRYVTLVDLDKMLVCCQPYQGTLLSFLSIIYNKRLTFKSDQALFTFVQLHLMEISTKAFTFYHNMASADKDFDFSGTTLPRKSSMLELSAEKFLNRGGHLYSDCRIIKHLSELVKIQQIDEEFKAKFLTDAPVCPFAVDYHAVQTFRM